MQPVRNYIPSTSWVTSYFSCSRIQRTCCKTHELTAHDVLMFFDHGANHRVLSFVSRHSHKLEALRILSSKHLRHMASMFTTMGIRPRNLTGLSLESSSAGFGWDGTRSIQEVSPSCSSMEHTGRMMRFMSSLFDLHWTAHFGCL